MRTDALVMVAAILAAKTVAGADPGAERLAEHGPGRIERSCISFWNRRAIPSFCSMTTRKPRRGSTSASTSSARKHFFASVRADSRHGRDAEGGDAPGRRDREGSRRYRRADPPRLEIVLVRYPPVKKGESIRLRISETYTDPVSYRLDGEELVFDRSLGRPRNAVVLPAGWFLTASSVPATVSETADGRIRLDFVNPAHGRHRGPDSRRAPVARRLRRRSLAEVSAGDPA